MEVWKSKTTVERFAHLAVVFFALMGCGFVFYLTESWFPPETIRYHMEEWHIVFSSLFFTAVFAFATRKKRI